MKPKTSMERIQGILSRPRTLLEVKLELNRLTGKHMLETALSARIRQLRKRGLTVVCTPVHREGRSTLYTYFIPREPKKAAVV